MRVDAEEFCQTHSCSGACRWPRELVGLTTHGKLCLRVAGSLHVSELERSLLAEVVEASGNHDFRLATEDSVARDLDGLKGSRAR